MKKCNITLKTFMLLTLLCGCTKTKQEFKLDVIDASIFDIGEFRNQEDVSKNEIESLVTGCAGVAGIAGISITFDLYFTDDDFNLKALKNTMYYLRKSHNDPHVAYSGFFGEPLIQAFGDLQFYEQSMLRFVCWGDIDLKQKVIKGCTLYGAICGEDRFKNKDFKIIFDRKKLLKIWVSHDEYIYRDDVPEYTKEITFNYDRLTFPNYNSMDDFIASIKNTSAKKSFNSHYEDLFKNFSPSNPQKGYFMHFSTSNSLESDWSGFNPEIFENDQLYYTLNPHEAHLIIYEKTITRITSDMIMYRYGTNYSYPSEIIRTITVYDIVSRKIIYSKTFGGNDRYDQKKIGEEIKALLK